MDRYRQTDTDRERNEAGVRRNELILVVFFFLMPNKRK